MKALEDLYTHYDGTVPPSLHLFPSPLNPAIQLD